MNVGDVVRFAVPQTEEERVERFIVLELRGPRVLVEFICDMSIKPTFTYPAEDLILA